MKAKYVPDALVTHCPPVGKAEKLASLKLTLMLLAAIAWDPFSTDGAENLIVVVGYEATLGMVMEYPVVA